MTLPSQNHHALILTRNRHQGGYSEDRLRQLEIVNKRRAHGIYILLRPAPVIAPTRISINMIDYAALISSDYLLAPGLANSRVHLRGN